jgi:hypothetical protein
MTAKPVMQKKNCSRLHLSLIDNKLILADLKPRLVVGYFFV